MEIADFYPEPDEMIANEVETIKFFMHSPILEEHTAFYTAARIVFNQASPKRPGFSFSSHLDLHYRHMPYKSKAQYRHHPNVRLIFSALIEQASSLSYGNISYVFAICRLDKKRNSILRKFHFDVSVTTGTRQPQPITHLQYCGEMIDVMRNLSYRDSQLEQLHNKLREPRVFFSPISLALLVDMGLREFGDEDLKTKVINTPEWKNLIRKNEKLVLSRFFESCFTIANSSDDRRPTILDEFYCS